MKKIFVYLGCVLGVLQLTSCGSEPSVQFWVKPIYEEAAQAQKAPKQVKEVEVIAPKISAFEHSNYQLTELLLRVDSVEVETDPKDPKITDKNTGNGNLLNAPVVLNLLAKQPQFLASRTLDEAIKNVDSVVLGSSGAKTKDVGKPLFTIVGTLTGKDGKIQTIKHAANHEKDLFIHKIRVLEKLERSKVLQVTVELDLEKLLDKVDMSVFVESEPGKPAISDVGILQREFLTMIGNIESAHRVKTEIIK
jgi:hypothetical protein